MVDVVVVVMSTSPARARAKGQERASVSARDLLGLQFTVRKAFNQSDVLVIRE
jgi:hypothetical protein